MADYPSALTGAQMDIALLDVAQHNSEAWAVGTRSGNAVSSGDETYNNNAKYYAESAYESAARASGSIPSGTAGAVFFDRAQSLTDSQKEQARANIGSANSNRNLLDNWWFSGGGGTKLPINQRGETSYTGSKYCVDRWYQYSGTLTTSIQSDCIRLTATSSGNGLFFQFLAQAASGTYTISAYVRGTGAGYVGVCGATSSHDYIDGVTFSNVGNNWTLIQKTFTSSSAVGGVRCRIDAGTSIDIRAIKLERGSVSTLPNDAPPNYAEELMKCQYYCRGIYLPSGYFYWGGYCQSTTQFRSFAFPPMNVRSSIPDVTLSGSAIVVDPSGTGHSVSAFSSAWQTSTNSGVTVFAETTGLTVGQMATLRINEGARVIISCDIPY